MTAIRERLLSLQDETYRTFTIKLTPGVDPDSVIGVRQPALHALAKELRGTPAAEVFLNELPHQYFEEYHLHSFLLSIEKDSDKVIAALDRYLPYVDNWAVCDSLHLKAFDKDPERLLPHIDRWLASDHTFTVRCGIKCLMDHFLCDHFSPAIPDRVAAIKSGEYYVQMMAAWFFATALAKQYEPTLPYIESGRLDKAIHNKAIQKAVESYRVTEEHKAYLKTLKRK